MNEFSEYYRTISNTELLQILDNPGNYLSAAVEAAKQEFSERQLSETDIQNARQRLVAIQEEKRKQKDNIKSIESKLRTKGYSFIGSINPLRPEISATEKNIRILVCVFGGLFLYTFIKQFKAITLWLGDIVRFPLESISFLFPLVLLGIATFHFGKRKKIGWILLTSFTLLEMVTVIAVWVKSYGRRPSGFSALDDLLPRPSPINLILYFLVMAGGLWVLCKENIRELYSVDKQLMFKVISVAGIVSLCLMIAIS